MTLNGFNGQMFNCGVGRIDSSHCQLLDWETGQVQCNPQRRGKRGRTVSRRNEVMTLFWGMLVSRCLKDSHGEKDDS